MLHSGPCRNFIKPRRSTRPTPAEHGERETCPGARGMHRASIAPPPVLGCSQMLAPPLVASIACPCGAQPSFTQKPEVASQYHTVISRAPPPMGAGACGPAKRVLDCWTSERRFTPPNIEARPSASGARRRSYTRGSEVGDRCRPSLKPQP